MYWENQTEMNERTIILHHHLFKNAGTSLDRILKENFPGRWVTREFTERGFSNTRLVEDWIRSEPNALAFSSHTMIGPLPKVDGVRILSVLFLRDPISRIVSAYNFERRQQAETVGTQIARENTLEGYVRTRLDAKGDRQCRNFQVARLAALNPGPEPELDRAVKALSQLSFVGKVEDFASSIAEMTKLFTLYFPRFSARPIHANISDRSNTQLSAELASLLELNNQDDRLLLEQFDRQRATRARPYS